MFIAWMLDTYISNGGELIHWDLINLRTKDFNHDHVHHDHASPSPNTPLTATSTPGAGSIMSASQ